MRSRPRQYQASAIAPAIGLPDDPALETSQMRQYHEQWLHRSGGRAAFGLSGVPATRFRGVVRFLRAFAAGEGRTWCSTSRAAWR